MKSLSQPSAITRTTAAIAAAFAILAGPARAHPEIEEQIGQATKLIKAEGSVAGADLFLQRGELHRVHENWGPALADFERALAIDPTLGIVHYCRGRLFLEKGEPRRALEDLDRFVESVPGDSRGLALRARAHADLNQYERADADYAAAVRGSDRPSPQLVLEWAEFRLAAGGAGEGRKGALAALDRGTTRLGPLVTLQTRAIDLECDHGNFDEALVRIDVTTATNGNTPLWMKRKAEILVLAGRHGDGIRAYRETLARLDGLPESRRNVRAVRAMREDIEQELRRIASSRKVEK